MKRFMLVIITSVFLFSCTHEGWQKTADGVIVNIPEGAGSSARKIAVDVINENIIHISNIVFLFFSDIILKSLCFN